MENVCFSGAALSLLGAIWLVIQAAIVYLFRGWVGSLRDQITACHESIQEARAERDRMADGWEATIGLGEKAVRRERGRR